MAPSVTTRAATEQDDAFLFALFKAVRSAEFAPAFLPPAQLEALLAMQYSGQKCSYRAEFPGGDRIVLLDEQPVGRLWLHHGPGQHHLVDIALLPQFQNRGIGAALVTQAIAAARAAGVRLCCSVATNNPGSLAFHQRLGFHVVAQDAMYFELAIEP